MLSLKRKHSSPSDESPSSHLEAPHVRDGAHYFTGPRAKRPSMSPQAQNDVPPVDEEFFRKLYLTEIDFRKLGKKFPEFGECLSGVGGRTIRFDDPASFMQLTKTLLKADFGLQVELPDDRLCPPVPNRHKYIMFLKNLLDSSTYHRDPSNRACCGIDIGTGASAIYPLLGTAQRPWTFLATEADLKNTEYARRNVILNKMDDKITVLGPRDTAGPLIPFNEPGVRHKRQLHFLMTNPPFYESEEELLTLARQKARPPLSACTGAPIEMVCTGGEVAFVSKIFIESLVWKDRIQWYTSMLGKLESVEKIVKIFKDNDIDNYAVSGLVQGNKTKRWVVAWSFGAMRPSQEVASGIKVVGGKKVAPASVEEEVFRAPGDSDANVEKVRRGLLHIVEDLDSLYWETLVPTTGSSGSHSPHLVLEIVGRARKNIWSREWRRKKARGEVMFEPEIAMLPDGACAFGFSILVEKADEAVEVVVRWREGHDHVMFESFCGFLRRKLTETFGEGS